MNAAVGGPITLLDPEPESEAVQAARWRWARTLLDGDDTPEANRRTNLIAYGFILGKPLDEMIDADIAMKASKGETI